MLCYRKPELLHMVLLALGSMRFRPISVWLSATPDVAEGHKINTQSACLRQLVKVSLLFAHSLELHEKAHYAPPMSPSVRQRAYSLTIFDEPR